MKKCKLITTKLLLVVGFGLSFFNTIAQTSYTIGNGTASNLNWEYPSPLPDYYESSKQQFLYTVAEATAAGMTAGNITGIQWDVLALNGTGPIEEYTIKLGTTTASSLSATGWELTNILAFGPQTYQPLVGINTFTFGTPFAWNGTSNIVVEICVGDASNLTADTYTYNPSVAYTIVPFNGSRTLSYDSWGNICGSSDTIRYHQIPNRRPNINFLMGGGTITCQTPSGVTLSSVTSSSASAAWLAPAGVSGFQYVVDQNPNAPTGIGISVSGNNVTITSLAAGTSYYFHIRSVCTNGTISSWVNSPFTTSIQTGTPDLQIPNNLISFSPNPASSEINLIKKDNKQGQLLIIDLAGRILKRVEVQEERTRINLSEFARGIYFLHYYNEEKSEVLKINKI